MSSGALTASLHPAAPVQSPQDGRCFCLEAESLQPAYQALRSRERAPQPPLRLCSSGVPTHERNESCWGALRAWAGPVHGQALALWAPVSSPHTHMHHRPAPYSTQPQASASGAASLVPCGASAQPKANPHNPALPAWICCSGLYRPSRRTPFCAACSSQGDRAPRRTCRPALMSLVPLPA